MEKDSKEGEGAVRFFSQESGRVIGHLGRRSARQSKRRKHDETHGHDFNVRDSLFIHCFILERKAAIVEQEGRCEDYELHHWSKKQSGTEEQVLEKLN